MKKIIMSAVALTAIMGSVNVASAADGINIFSDVKVKGQIRPRAEYVDVTDNGRDKGAALTARTHLVVSAGLLGVENLSATVGIQSVNNFGYTHYDSKANGQDQYEVIKDPNFAMLSEASLNYKTGKTALHAGRSQLNLDNQRFIGTVGWRQLERSYDTVSATDNSIENLKIFAAYLYGTQGVGAGDTAETNSVLLNVKYKVADALTVTAYDYMLSSLSDTLGLSLTGKFDAGAKFTYRAEYALQKDATMEYGSASTQKNVKADATYYNLDLATNISGVIAGLNYEVLSGKNADNTKTTFNPKNGTNHKFNGWADVFYVAGKPDGGLKDANIRLGYKAKGFGKVLAVYHNYTADTTITTGASNNLGSEIDVVYVNKIPGVNGLKGLLKFASFSKGDVANEFDASKKDKQVVWAQLDYKFTTK
ncbi:hypothetical protein [uncultured Sulfurimonas sp.]|jgi:hypothetical protein|uniref:hypothetical protein n=1 Tax=uncultured Sulfurimonas sp. TaxID=291845 RepID=UPI0032B1BE89